MVSGCCRPVQAVTQCPSWCACICLATPTAGQNGVASAPGAQSAAGYDGLLPTSTRPERTNTVQATDSAALVLHLCAGHVVLKNT
jgi:hypothetical protein